MARITRIDRSSVQFVIPTPAYENLQNYAATLSTPENMVAMSDVVRMALTEYFAKRGQTIDFTVDRGGYRQRKTKTPPVGSAE